MTPVKSALALSAVLLVAACGGGGSSQPALAASPPAAATTAPAPAPAPATSTPSASPTVIANTDTTARGVAVLEGGTMVAAWSDGSGVHSQLFDAQGRLAGGEVSVAPSGLFTGVAALAGGAYAVEFSQPGVVLVQVVSAAGTLTGAAATVRTQAQVAQDLAGNMQPALAGGAGVFALSGGAFAAEYRTSHEAHIPGDYPGELMAQRYDAQGNPIGAPVGITSEAPGSPAASASTSMGELLTAMTELCPCMGSGTARVTVQDANLQRVATFEKAPGDMTAHQGAAQLANGNYLAVWTTQAGQVQGQLFALDASTLTGSRSVSSVLTFANAGAGARVTALAGGGFLLAWAAAAQAFDAGGQPAGGVMQILDGSIAASPDGGFVVVAQVGSQLVGQRYAVGP